MSNVLMIEATLQEAKEALLELEKRHGITTEEFLNAVAGDPSVAEVDTFEEIEWAFRAAQVTKLTKQLEEMEQPAASEQHSSTYSYGMANRTHLAHQPGKELKLAA